MGSRSIPKPRRKAAFAGYLFKSQCYVSLSHHPWLTVHPMKAAVSLYTCFLEDFSFVRGLELEAVYFFFPPVDPSLSAMKHTGAVLLSGCGAASCQVSPCFMGKNIMEKKQA